jgi:antitoxin HicB
MASRGATMVGCVHEAQGKRVGRGTHAYTVLLQPEPEGGYTVTCPALPGLVTYGESLEEARAMAADAIPGYIECLQEDGEPIPGFRGGKSHLTTE